MDLPVGAAIDDAVSRVFEPIQLTGESVLDTSLLFAMIVYGFVALFLEEAIDWLTSRIARRRLQLEPERSPSPRLRSHEHHPAGRSHPGALTGLALAGPAARAGARIIWLHRRARLSRAGDWASMLRMATADPQDGSADPQDGTADRPPRRKRNVWIWISAALAIVAAGLLIWALTIQSDLDSTQEENASTEQKLASTQKELDGAQQELDTTKQDLAELESEPNGRLATGVALLSGKALYDEVVEELDATSADLASTQQDLEEADNKAKQAEQDAKKAKQAAADAETETEKAEAEADQATADVEAAQSKAAVAADCAKAYISAFGVLFEGDSPEDQAPEVRKQLSAITATCKDDLAGT